MTAARVNPDQPRDGGPQCTCGEILRAHPERLVRHEAHLVGCPRWGTVIDTSGPDPLTGEWVHSGYAESRPTVRQGQCWDESPTLSIGEQPLPPQRCELPHGHGGAHEASNGPGVQPTRWKLAAAPGASRDTAEEVREEIARTVVVETLDLRWQALDVADAVLDLPSVRRLLDAEAAVRELHKPYTRDTSWSTTETICNTCRYDDGSDAYVWPCPTIAALDGGVS